MNDTTVIFNASNSDFSATQFEESSSTSLNRNVQFSELNISDISHTANMTANNISRELSITMDTREKHLLCADYGTEMRMSNGQSLTETRNGNAHSAHDIVDMTHNKQNMPKLEWESTQTVMPQFEMTEIIQTRDERRVNNIPAFGEQHFFQDSLIELGRRLWISDANTQRFTKGCLWSPDGTCVLVSVNRDGMHIIELPNDLYQDDAISKGRQVHQLPSAVHVKEGGTVYDCAWYPYMNSTAPETCCWIATRQHEPIHMWDAFDGALRCSYRGYDDVDEVESAISIIFSNDGDKIFGGYKKSIKIFDTKKPGRDYTTIPVKQAISCFALRSNNNDTITTGSWNGFINHYDLRAPKIGPLFKLSGHNGGITWLRYATADKDYLLFSGARKDNKILEWDMRDYRQPLCEFQRNVATNQRIYFDLSPQCEWLVSGDTSGLLRIWDLHNQTDNIELQLHQDCCNGINFHPTLPILATTSGQYHFIGDSDSEQQKRDKEILVNYENSLLFLWFGKLCESPAAEETIDQ